MSDLVLYYQYEHKPNWLKLKFIMMTFLAINAFVFLVLVPMMPELVVLAKESLSDGQVSQEYLEKAHIKQLIGMSNVIPLVLEILLGSFKPKLGKERN